MNKNPIKNIRNASDLRPAVHEATTVANRNQEGFVRTVAQPQSFALSIAQGEQPRSAQTGLRRAQSPAHHAPDVVMPNGSVFHRDAGIGRVGSAAPAPAALNNSGINHSGSPFPTK